MNKYTLDEFKNFIKKERNSFKDVIDIKNGNMVIHKSNIDKYLEKYMCKNEDDLCDTLYYSMGVWVKIID